VLECSIRRSNRRDGAGSNIQADDAMADSPTQRCGAFLDQLDVPTGTAADVSANDPAVFRPRLESLGLPRIGRIKNRRQLEPTVCDGNVPEDNRALGFLAFDAVELVEAPELGPAPLAEDVLLDRAETTQ
jgi:hypothetical protein